MVRRIINIRVSSNFLNLCRSDRGRNTVGRDINEILGISLRNHNIKKGRSVIKIVRKNYK